MHAIFADITTLKIDAIVNAANTSLLGGGGVDRAIHLAAGRELLLKCMTLNGCETGDAVLTPGYNLPAKYIIHTVGPIWLEGRFGEAEQLASCYQRSLEIAEANNIRTIAFPSISTGVFGYPFEEAAQIAVNTVQELLAAHHSDIEVTFCCYSESDLQVYQRTLGTE